MQEASLPYMANITVLDVNIASKEGSYNYCIPYTASYTWLAASMVFVARKFKTCRWVTSCMLTSLDCFSGCMCMCVWVHPCHTPGFFNFIACMSRRKDIVISDRRCGNHVRRPVYSSRWLSMCFPKE